MRPAKLPSLRHKLGVRRSPAKSSRSAETSHCEKAAFFARNSGRRDRTILFYVVNSSGGDWRNVRDQVPASAPGDPEVVRSPLRAHPASALWCKQHIAQILPQDSPLCELHVDIIELPPFGRPGDRLLCVEFELVGRPLFRCVQMLEKCCRSARYCKEIGPSNGISNEEANALCCLIIKG